MQRSLPFKLVLAALTLAYVMVASEFFLRWVAPVPVMPRYVTGAPYGVRMNVPNRTYWQTTPETHIRFHINSQGMRADRDYDLRKPDGICRIVMLGDSFFMGYEVDLKDSIQYRLEQSLRNAGYPCEVINLAVSGMGTAESLITYENIGKAFTPDIVLLEMHRTNLDNNARSGLFKLQNGKLAQVGTQYLPGVRISDFLMQSPVYCWISENSQLYSALREKIAAFVKSLVVFLKTGVIDNSVGISTDEEGEKAMEEKRALNLAIVQRLEEEAKPARLMMVEIPDFVTRTRFRSFNPLDPSRNPYLATGQYITAIEDMQNAAANGHNMYYERGEGHLTPDGTATLTNKVAKSIMDLPQLERYHHPQQIMSRQR